MERKDSPLKKERQTATMDGLAQMRAGCALPEGVPEVRVFSATARRCTDRETTISLIASTSTARVDAAISAVERIALDELREEMAAVFARRRRACQATDPVERAIPTG